MQQHRPPPLPLPTTILLGSGARPRNAMNLVCRKSKIREKTGLGAQGRIQAQPGDGGRLAGWFSQIREIRERTDFRGGKNKWGGGGVRELLSSASVQWKQVCATLPYLPPPASTIFLLFHFFWWHH